MRYRVPRLYIYRDYFRWIFIFIFIMRAKFSRSYYLQGLIFKIHFSRNVPYLISQLLNFDSLWIWVHRKREYDFWIPFITFHILSAAFKMGIKGAAPKLSASVVSDMLGIIREMRAECISKSSSIEQWRNVKNTLLFPSNVTHNSLISDECHPIHVYLYNS